MPRERSLGAYRHDLKLSCPGILPLARTPGRIGKGARKGDIGATLMNEAKQRKANLIVMGGYGHSRLREWFLGGTTYELLHEAHVPLLVAH
jgi:nucleotide-binding universal stress UspA family protein